VPEWLAETPYDVAYRLAMRDSGDDREYSQVVGLARKEFLLLKAYVAKLRRIPIPKEMPKRLSIAPALEIPFGGNSSAGGNQCSITESPSTLKANTATWKLDNEQAEKSHGTRACRVQLRPHTS
jgi:hypothetical protein